MRYRLIVVVSFALALSTPCVAQLPDRAKTPGVVRALSMRAVCTTKWGKDQRHVTTAMKRRVLAAYGLTWDDRVLVEIDHLVSRELGGADDVQNLWPERWDVVVGDRQMGARQKDRVEHAAHRAVCAGTLSLAETQREIARDWTALYVRLIGPFPLAK